MGEAPMPRRTFLVFRKSATPCCVKRLWLFLIGAIVIGAYALRLFAARDEFWVDEIISWRFARSPQASVLGILFGIHSDNNHHLNTLWMYLIGDRWQWMWYRVPAVLFGAGAVALAANL